MLLDGKDQSTVTSAEPEALPGSLGAAAQPRGLCRELPGLTPAWGPGTLAPCSGGAHCDGEMRGSNRVG